MLSVLLACVAAILGIYGLIAQQAGISLAS